ncbi:MAG TPA: selenocysteine-specific translation elongation factor [Solirubrobacterales bacterium]|jgi:selenocysteine-specific elongation factor
MAARPLTVGTAGHIDHGKTALVAALTGRDTDRLAEEKRRGISIELGFAALDLADRRLSLVDVPGHERFVRTMIAGASGIDMYLLVVAADDGVMPQTSEHMAVLRALGVEAGVVAVSKCDLVDADVRAAAAEQAAALAPGAPLVAVSARTGAGIEELRGALSAVAAAADAETDSASSGEPPVLHVDRVFTLSGYGTVVTGTLWSGRIERGRRVQLLPSGAEARVRSLEVHDRRLEVAEAHQRVALNLAGVGREEVRRGDVVSVAGSGVETTFRLDVRLREGAERIAAERRVQVHLGTREAPASVADLGGGAVQLRLEQPLLARRGDRVVVRRIAPPDTLGGGLVVEASPPRHGPGWKPAREQRPSQRPAAAARPAEPGAPARRLLAELRDDGSRPRGTAALAEAVAASRRETERALSELVAAGEAVRVDRDVVYPATEYRRLRTAIMELAEGEGSTSVAEVRDSLGLGRKHAQALLEHLDAERALRREGDRHFPRARRRG